MTKRTACIVFLFCAATAISASAQTFTTLVSFNGSDGSTPHSSPVQGTDGNLYGATQQGGVSDGGIVFKMTPQGTLTTLSSFCSENSCTDGEYPNDALVLAADGNFYGTASQGGVNGYGTVFKMTPEGDLTTLYSFCSEGGCVDGRYPDGALILAADGNFYGTTSQGGTDGEGTVFKVTPEGVLTTLHSFVGSDGAYPDAGLLQAADGNFYGTASQGGPNVGGTVFKMTPQGVLTTLHGFCLKAECADGESPYAGLVQAADGSFYGTTANGGPNLNGIVFKITPSGVLTVLYSFCSEAGCADGQSPYAGLAQATDGNFYGTTNYGGTGNGGTVFKITPQGTLTTLYTFCSETECADGGAPYAGLVQATNGRLYGTTSWLGGYGYGTVFSVSVGLGRFVETIPAFGKVGENVTILGNGLKGSTSVSLNGTPATAFTASNTAIRATVPTGATTGSVEVVTASGRVLRSNAKFRIIP
jgi:uncharacterized repeat protein (TIGR03803 family)